MRIPLQIMVIALVLFSCKKEDPVSPSDLTPKPRLHIAAPVGGSLITGPVTIEIFPDQTSKVQLVEFFIDSVSIGTDSLPSPFSKTWYAGFWADGLQHQIFGIGRDASGDTTHAGPVTVTVSADAQAIGLAAPGPGQTIQGPMVIALVIPNEIVLVSAEFVLDGSITLGRDTTAPFEKIWNPAFWADGGTHTLLAVVVDSSGRTGKAGPVSFTIPSDALGYPVPVFPANLLVVDDLEQTFRWNASPTATSYEIEISPESDFSVVEWNATIADTFYTATLLERSLYFWRVRAINEFQNLTRWADAEFATTPTFTRTLQISGYQMARDVLVTPDGGYVVSGLTEFGLSIIKVDRSGEDVWTWNSGMASDYGEVYDVEGTSDGGIVAAGRVYSETEGNFILIRLTSGGGFIWMKKFGGFWDEGGTSVVQMDDGGFSAFGYLEDESGKGRKGFVLRTNSMGDSLWSKVYNVPRSAIEPRKVLRTADDGLVLLGTEWKFETDTVASAFPADVWIYRTDANGDSVWSHVYGTAGDDDYAAGIAAIPGGYVVTYHATPYQMGVSDIKLMVIDGLGNTVLSEVYGSPELNDVAQTVVASSSGDYLLAGSVGANMQNTYNALIIRTDGSGLVKWVKEFSGASDEHLFAAQETADGGFILAGGTNQNILLMKTDRRGRIAGLQY